ncbi:2'-5' RNA ligase family protein [Algoriphagus sp. Y33]|uniref:2'-5' RNA ligase family protein n=1 Tax=Algoriphagus sp. Y33 TaxID=2772483 RepID=UPI00178270E9|nr:2'-5' RNA ligase family protein [Algoriphagus sp. Y33]
MNIFEYLLIISPNEEINRDVMSLKKEFANRYGCKKAAGLTPHITMGNWLQSSYREARIIANIKRFAETVNPFLAQFDGIGKFEPKTIFVDVLNKESFADISRGLRHSSSSLLKKHVAFPSTAHLTIARSMEPEQFEQAWSDYKNEEFKDSCEINGMILLRRPFRKEGYSKFNRIGSFPFEGKRPHVEQLELGF